MRTAPFGLLVLLGLLSCANAASRTLIRVSASNAVSNECASSALAPALKLQSSACVNANHCYQLPTCFSFTQGRQIDSLLIRLFEAAALLSPFTAMQGSQTGQRHASTEQLLRSRGDTSRIVSKVAWCQDQSSALPWPRASAATQASHQVLSTAIVKSQHWVLPADAQGSKYAYDP